MKKIYALLLFCAFHFSSFGGNVAGGDVSYQCISGNTVQFTLTIWGNNFLPNDSFQFFYGDNASSIESVQTANSNINLAPTYPGFSELKWVFIHNYPGAGNYQIRTNFTNRNTGIDNIPNSVNAIMTLSSNIIIDPAIGCNSSPTCTNNNLIELLTSSTNFNSNLGAIDPDGDSLSFQIGPCSDTNGVIVGYTYPNLIGGGSFGINTTTGDFYWNAPQTTGLFNFVIYIEQWKLLSNNQYLFVGTVSREIQLFVGTSSAISEQMPIVFSTFPNPISQGESFKIQFEKEGNYVLKIYDVEGKSVFENTGFYQIETLINMPVLSKGIYFLIIRDENHNISSQKILVQNP